MAAPNHRWHWRHCLAAIVTGVAMASTVATPAAADGIRDQQWYLSFLKAEEVHKINRGSNFTVAVVDTGVDGNHPDLKGNVLPGMDLTADTGGNGWTDIDGHGTKMAGLIAGHGHGQDNGDGILGLGPDIKILPIRIFTSGGDRLKPGERNLVPMGIRMAASRGAKVINVSVGGGTGTDIKDAIEYAVGRGAIVVAAAGNTAQGASHVESPARFPGVVAVSGTDESGRFSSESASGPEVVIAAPVTDIVSTQPGGRYATGTGTSSSTALVSAAAALVWAKYPELEAKNVINRLISTADDKGPKGRDKEYGFGVVNPLKALTADVPKIDHDPLDPSASPSQPAAAPTKNSGDNPGESGLPGYLIPTFAILGSILILAAIIIAVAITRSRRRMSASIPPDPSRRAY